MLDRVVLLSVLILLSGFYEVDILISSLQIEKLRLGEIKGLHPYSDASLGDPKAQEGIICSKQGNLHPDIDF